MWLNIIQIWAFAKGNLGLYCWPSRRTWYDSRGQYSGSKLEIPAVLCSEHPPTPSHPPIPTFIPPASTYPHLTHPHPTCSYQTPSHPPLNTIPVLPLPTLTPHPRPNPPSSLPPLYPPSRVYKSSWNNHIYQNQTTLFGSHSHTYIHWAVYLSIS